MNRQESAAQVGGALLQLIRSAALEPMFLVSCNSLAWYHKCHFQVRVKMKKQQEEADDELWISVETTKAMFDKLVDEIVTCTNSVLMKAGGHCEVMLLVGGFGSSPYLKSRLQSAFSGLARHVLSPEDAGAAVLKGERSLNCLSPSTC